MNANPLWEEENEPDHDCRTTGEAAYVAASWSVV